MEVRRVHRIVGAVTLLAFIATGAYMRFVYHGMAGVEMATRITFRTRHLFILGAALVHLALGAYLTPAATRRRQAWQTAGSVLLCLATPPLIIAFFVDPFAPGYRTELSSLGLYALLAGTLLHVLAAGRGAS
jgi:NO-binding membrane sensor protein with MHYT domain